MYAVLKSVGKQFKVSPGDVLKIDKIEGKVGDTISFKDIVAVGNGDKFELGSPAVKGAEVSAKLLYQTRDDKIRVFRKNRRKHFQRTKGHRQYISILKVMAIKSAIGEESFKEPVKKAAPNAETPKKVEKKSETPKKTEVKATETKKVEAKRRSADVVKPSTSSKADIGEDTPPPPTKSQIVDMMRKKRGQFTFN